MVGVQGNGECVFGVIRNGEVARQDVAGADGDDAHAHARPGHAGRDRAHGPVSTGGDDDGRAFFEGMHGLPGAGVLACGLAPVHVVDAKFLGLAVNEVLESLWIIVLRGVHDDPWARPAALRVVRRCRDGKCLPSAMTSGERCDSARDSDCSGSCSGCEYPRCSVHVHILVCLWIKGLWTGCESSLRCVL